MRRTLSKKHISVHKQTNINEELGEIQDAQLTADNILDKLLRPNPSDKKISINQKYRPKFEKRDNETLSKENMNLKLQLKNQRQVASQLKFRLTEAERKVKFLEGIQEKWEQSVQENLDGKRLEVYTQILKKKMQELNELYLSSQEKITELKKLPHISIFDEHTIEMEHLQRETVRLKSIIASSHLSQDREDDLQNKLLKLMKQENEKLKATIRLFENDKNLLKSRQTIQKRQITDLKKQIEDLKKKLTIREAQLQKSQNQIKNILLKKAFQLRTDQEKRQNEQISKLKSIIDDNRIEIQRIELQKEQLAAESMKLKKNEKIWQNKQNLEDRQKNDLKVEISRLKRLIEDMKGEEEREKENLRIMEQHTKKRKIYNSKPIIPIKIERLNPIKYEQLELSLITIIHALQSGQLPSISQLFPEEDNLKCSKIIDILTYEPVSLYRSQAIKLVRYLTESDGRRNTGFNQKQEVNRQLCLTILKASLNRMTQCRNTPNEDLWRCVLAKARKLIPQLQKMRGMDITKNNLLDLLSLHINQPFGPFVDLLVLQTLNKDQSQVEVVLSVDSILDFFSKVTSNLPLRQSI